MKKRSKPGLVALFMGLQFAVNAQTPLEKLFSLEGQWQGEATLILEGNSFNFTYYIDAKVNAERTGMTIDESFTHPDLGGFKGYNMIGYNARDGKVHWFSVDNFGTCHEHLGYWKTVDHFYMETSEKRNGKKFDEKIDIIFQSEDEVSYHIIATLGGQLYEDASAIFHRQAGSGRKADASKESNTSKRPSAIPKETIGSAGYKIFPNPAKDQINIQLPNNISFLDLKLSIFNAGGEKIKDELLQSTISNITLNGYKPGVYVYKILNKDQILNTGKFIVR